MKITGRSIGIAVVVLIALAVAGVLVMTNASGGQNHKTPATAHASHAPTSSASTAPSKTYSGNAGILGSTDADGSTKVVAPHAIEHLAQLQLRATTLIEKYSQINPGDTTATRTKRVDDYVKTIDSKKLMGDFDEYLSFEYMDPAQIQGRKGLVIQGTPDGLFFQPIKGNWDHLIITADVAVQAFKPVSPHHYAKEDAPVKEESTQAWRYAGGVWVVEYYGQEGD